jgi:hypothetical protein
VEKVEINNILDKMISSLESGKIYKKKKYVSYDIVLSRNRVILNRDDINEDKLKRDLWWSSTDFLEFYNQARFELSYFMALNPRANKQKYSKTLWYDLDFDKIYKYVILYGIIPIELIKLQTNK